MLHFEVIDAQDKSFIGIHDYFMNEITFGRHRNNNVIIENIQKFHLRVFVDKEGGLFCQSSAPDSFFLFNGKKISGKKKLGPGDIIQLGDFVFKFPLFSYTPDFKDRNIKDLYFKAIKEKPELKEIFKVLEEEILKERERERGDL